MLTNDFVNAVYVVAEGKQPTFTSGSTKWNKILAIANNKIDAWQEEDEWKSLYNPKVSLGMVTATDTFPLPVSVRVLSKTPSDTVRVLHADGVKFTDYDLVAADRLKDFAYGNYCAQIGRNIVFNRAFTSADQQFGGTLYVPGYTYASHLVADGDTVPVDIPQWLVLVTAGEYNRGDIVKQNQYPNLVNEANDLMEAMKKNNRAQNDYVDMPWRPAGANW